MSKTPVREALSLLNHEGLVQILPRKAYVVSPITVRDVHDCFDLRVILESAAAELAATSITEPELARLESIVASESSTASLAATLERNSSLHSLIARASRNERLVQLIEKLLSEMPRLITAGYIKGEHEQLIRALRQRNPKLAGDAMRAHILAVKEKALGVAVPGVSQSAARGRANVTQPRFKSRLGRK